MTQKEKNNIYNYDRLRVQTDYTDNGFFGTVIGDGINYLGGAYVNSNDFEYLKRSRSDTTFKTQTNFKDYGNGSAYAKLYRAYGGYEDAKNRVVVGLQNISMGVGRIWTPTNIFNPKNIYALEPDEVFGVSALSYVRYLDETSHVTFVASQNSEHSYKYAGQYKSFLNFADVALNVVSSDRTKMIAYEIEGNLADTGVELRSEAAYIKSTLFDTSYKENKKEFYQGVVGAEYGFKNGVTLVLESLYSSKKFSYDEVLSNLNSDILSNLVYSNFYTGATLSYSFNLFLDASILYIESFSGRNSRFVSPTLKYTLNDYNSFMIGAQIQNGKNESEFGAFENRYYFKWSLSF
ncbi:hypothetical protein [Sulfurimonas sp.]|nr:hypothetical protein [Sulfurimonas sp.]